MIQKITKLKKEKNAIILAHNYLTGDIQDIADYVGDSLQLAKKAKEVEEDLIVLCGVKFMAETAKILNPAKKVLLPSMDAGCPMADMASASALKEFKSNNPDVKIVTYVNSSAEVKAESDICCTSANAVQVVKELGADRIVFVPDQNLGTFVEEELGNVEVVKWKGFCPTHHRVTVEDIEIARNQYPGIEILVHPECKPEVFHAADIVGSTSKIIQYVRDSENKKFIIGTEKGIIHSLRSENPDKEFILLSEKLICKNMKKITLSDVLNVLENETNEIIIDQNIAEKANNALERMLSL